MRTKNIIACAALAVLTLASCTKKMEYNRVPWAAFSVSSIGVAENGCVWVTQTMKEKAVFFISEELVIVLDADHIVNNMHEGYRQIQVPESGYGCWISGPSKTADIEQALVMGAQAARSVTVLIRE